MDKVMIMHEWNGNGQFDPGDSFIDYQIYKETMKSGKQKPTGSGCLTTVIGAALIVALMIVMLVICS